MKQFVGVFFVACVLAVAPSSAQLKVAFVNSGTILKELPEAQQAQKDLETQVKVWQDELERMGAQLQAEVETTRRSSP